MGYGTWNSDKEEDEEPYDRDSFVDVLKNDGFSWREAEDIAIDWERHKDD